MTRTGWMAAAIAGALVTGHSGCSEPASPGGERVRDVAKETGTVTNRTEKSDAEWKAKLTPEQYQVTRCSATEAPGTGKYYHHKEPGRYLCVCCGQPLFTSEAKYDSGSGWPSFFQPVGSEAIREIKDTSHGMIRTELRCSRCDAHLGHVFEDGPKPTGLRYCINSAALDFEKRQE